MSRSATPHRTLHRSVAAALLVAIGGLAACGSDDAEPASETVTITETWSREPVDGQTTSAFYGVFTNDGDTSATAIAASSDVSDAVELHEVVMNDDGTMTMREREGGYEIPAGGSVTLEPGGLHVMLLDIDPATYPDEIDVTIEFDDGSTTEVSAEVRAIETTGDMDMDDGEVDGHQG